jgi:hypothetical protein
MYLRSSKPTRECPAYRKEDGTAFRSLLRHAEEGDAVLADVGDAPEQADNDLAPAILAREFLDMARRGGQRFRISAFTLALVDGHGANREALIE